MQALRRIIFYVLSVIYVAICPIVILYSFGFVLDPKKKEMVQTGLVQLKTIPEDATVHVESKKFAGKTPVLIRNLVPGDYKFRLHLEGYKPWERKVFVSTGKAVTYGNILLIPENWTKREVSSQIFSQMTPISDTHLMILARGNKLCDYFVFDWESDEMWPLVNCTGETREMNVLKLFTAGGSDVVVVLTACEGKQNYAWIRLEKEQPEIKDISTLFVEEPSMIVWDPGAPSQLFSWQDGYVNRLDIEQGAVYPKFAGDIVGFGLYDEEIYIIDQKKTLRRLDFDKKSEEILLEDPNLRSLLFESKQDVQIFFLDEKTLIFLDSRGSLVTNRLPYHFVKQGVIGWRFNRKKQILLLWMKGKIGILDFSETRKEDEGLFEQGLRVTWIYENGEDIRKCFWANNGSHVLFRDENKVYLLERDPYCGSVLHFLTQVDKGGQITYADETGDIYILEKPGGKLIALKLIPTKTAFSLIEGDETSFWNGTE
ncbi:MAG: hypothetical protein DRH21_07185 [Deltaproteobacteria bacterium]|nr:MAG: hypothetical protein DRH21_07185 [Deltaproteobacteria bacterium]